MNAESLITLTADITSAYVAHNQVEADKVGSLVSNIHQSLASLGQGQTEVKAPEPVVSVRASVKKDHLVCLVCGKKMKILKRHLAAEHGMSPEEYRQAYNLSGDYPLVASDYAETRRELAKKIGLGKSPNQKRGRKSSASVGKSRGGNK